MGLFFDDRERDPYEVLFSSISDSPYFFFFLALLNGDNKTKKIYTEFLTTTKVVDFGHR